MIGALRVAAGHSGSTLWIDLCDDSPYMITSGGLSSTQSSPSSRAKPLWTLRVGARNKTSQVACSIRIYKNWRYILIAATGAADHQE